MCYIVNMAFTLPQVHWGGTSHLSWAGQLGFIGLGLQRGKCACVMQGVNKSLRVEPLLTYKHLFQQYYIISTAYKNTHQTSDSGITPLCSHK